MPPKGYSSVTLRDDLLKALEPIAEQEGKSVGRLISEIMWQVVRANKGVRVFE